MWLFVNIIFMVQFTIAGTITFSEKPIDTIGILGDEVQLNCSFNDWTSEGLIWNKERPEEYAISLNEEVYQDGHYLVDEFGTGAYSLRIVNTTERHEGEYKCEAFGATLRSFAELYLMDELPTCDVYPGVTVKAGEDTTFNCSVYKAVPPGELRWRMDGNVVSTGGNSSTYSWVTSFDRTQNNAVMVCGLEYITLSEPLACEDTIVMDVQYTPEMGVVVTGDGSPTGQVIEGDSFLADCAVVDSNPEAENIRWFDADGDVVGTGERLEFNTVHRNQTDDAYTCMSSVSFYDGSQGNGSTVFTINVQYLSNVDVQYDDNGIAVEGDAFQATCTADANPDPEFTWIGPGESEVGRGYSLTLQDVEPGDSGMYSCYAKVTYWNGSSRTENASFELDVQFSPRMDRNVTGDASHGGKVIEGDSFAVECLVLDANPDHNDDIQWFDDEMNTVGDDEWLIFDEVDKSEAGNYTCTATNTFFNGGVGEGETAITIDVQYLYDVVIHEDSGGKVIKGDTYTAHCSAEANPTADIAWVDADGETVVDGSTLVFDDAQLSDAGLYVCRGDVVFWDLTPKSSSDSVLLDVQYISDVVIHDESDGKVIEGHSYYANCTADANPAAVVSWTTPGGDVTFGEELAKEGAERADSGNYTCTANVTYWDGTVEVTQSGFYLDIQYQPEVTIFDQSDGKSIEGDRYDAVCQVESNPDSDVAWVGPDDNVVASSPHLTFDAVGVENSGTYTCQANNTFWDGSTASGDAIIFIDVQYISDAVVFSENDGMVIEGSAFYANCSVEANPVAEMSWLTPFQNTIVGDILHIDKTSRTDSGNYTCVGSVTFWNGTVEESRSTILLDVQYSPNVDIEQASGGKVLEGERFNAECTAEANPDPDTVWQDPSGVTLSVGTTLVIDNTRLEDGGVYTCLANNTFWDGSVGSGNSTIFVDVQYMSDAVINYESGGRVIEGQTYYANCSADANPAAEISWRKPDGETLRSEYVEIDEADKTDGGNYTCIATTAFWDGTEGQSESSFYLDVQYISDVHIYEENEGKVIEGQGFYANCSSDANPAAVIAWRTPTGGSIDGAELVIEQAERTDDGSYVCTASTTYWDGSSDQSESDVFVDVQYLHEISIFNENDGKVIEGQTYYANCSADSNPTADISWLAPGGGQTPGEELQLEQASRTESGEYRCTATVTYWDETEVSDEKSVTVDVQYISDVQIYDKSNGKVIEGHAYYANCSSEANPEAVFTWLTPGGDELPGEELNIDQAVRADSGEYVCSANTTYWDGTVDHRNSTLLLDVQYISDVEIDEDSNGKIIQGHPYTANCSADANPVAAVMWSTPTGEIIENGLLEFPSTERSDSGDYICGANITYWDGTNDYRQSTLHVDIQYIEDVEIFDHSGGKVVEGYRYWANCSSDANPSASIWWVSPEGERRPDKELVIERTDRSHSGDYACVADTVYWDGTGDSRNSTIHLDVQYLSAAEIYEESSGKVIQGHPYYANCSAVSNPTAIISWMTPEGDTLFDAELWFENTTRSDDGVYKCRANVTFWDGSVAGEASTVYLDVQYLSEIVIYMDGGGKVIEGQRFYANCSADANPMAGISWWTASGQTQHGGELIILEAERYDSGHYTCKANVTYWDGSVDQNESEVFIDVQYMSNVVIEDESQGKVIEGHTYRANCTTDANPTAVIAWVTPKMEIHESELLEIGLAERNDTGNYTCEASTEFWDGSDDLRKASVFVDVQYSPSVEVQHSITLIENENTTLICDIIDANPAEVSFTWTLVDGTTYNTGIVELSNIGRSLHGSQICNATNTFYDGTRGHDSGVTHLDIQYSPELADSDLTRIEGETATLVCTVDSNPDPSTYSWTKDEVQVSDQITFSIEDVSRADDGDYICTATAEFHDGTTGSGQGLTQLFIQYSPDVEGGEVSCKEGDDITLHCEVDANPEPHTYNWTKDGQRLSDQQNHTIQATHRDQAGDYNCTAINQFHDGSEGKGHAVIKLEVQYLSTIDMVVSPSTQVNEGQDVSIRCRATDGNPDPYLMSLIRDPDEILAEEEASELQYDIRAIDRSKSGTYRCRASTRFYDGSEDISEEEQNIVVQYAPTIAEEDLTKFEAELKDRVTLNCTADGVPTPTVTWYDPGNKEIPGNEDNRKITTVEDGSIVTSSLAVTVVDDSFYGNYSCVASNVIGESNRHERIIEAPPSTAEPLSGVNIAVLVSVIVLIIVIFVVFAVVSYYRKEKKKAKYEASKKEQSTQGKLELDKIEIDGNANEGMSVVPDEADGLATFTGEAKNNEDMNGLGDINNETDVTFAGQEATPNGETDHSTVDIEVNGQL